MAVYLKNMQFYACIWIASFQSNAFKKYSDE